MLAQTEAMYIDEASRKSRGSDAMIMDDAAMAMKESLKVAAAKAVKPCFQIFLLVRQGQW